MNNEKKDKDGFSYTYSAKEQAEIKAIRARHSPPTEVESKLSRLRRLDRGVVGTAQAAALAFGIIGALLLGLGMSLVMTELGTALGLSGGAAVAVGIALGLPGTALCCLAYPVYTATVKAKRKRLAPEILRLTDELLK